MLQKVFLTSFFLSAVFLFTQVSYANTLDSLNVSLAKYRKEGNLADWITTRKNLCKYHFAQGNLKQAIQSIDVIEKEGWKKPTDSLEKTEWGWALVNRGYIKYNGGDYLGAKQDYVSAIGVFREVNDLSPLAINYTHNPLSNIYTQLGENEQAIRLLNVFIELNKKEKNAHFLGIGYNNLGLAYANKGDLEKALSWYQIGMQVEHSTDESLGLLASNAASVCLDLKKPEEAIRYAKKSLYHLEKSGNAAHIRGYISGTQTTFGTAYSKQGKFQLAHEHFEKARVILSHIYKSGQHRKWGKLHVARGNSLLDQGKSRESLKEYQNALRAVISDFHPTTNGELPRLEQVYPEVVIIEVVLKKAEAYQHLAKKNPLNREGYLKKAFEQYRFYFEVEGTYRGQYIDPASKLKFVQEAHQIGEKALEVTTELFTHTGNQKWLHQGIIFTEKTKGIVLSESMEMAKRQAAKKLPAEFQKLILLRSQAHSIQLEIKRATLDKKEEKVRFLKARESELAKDILLLDSKITKKHPELYQRLLETNQVNTQEFAIFQKGLKTNVLTYFFGEKTIYCFGVTRETITFSSVKVTPAVLQDIESFRAELMRPNSIPFVAFTRAAFRCYQLFFQPFESVIDGNEVVIIPDGPLCHLSFDAFCMQKGNNFRTLNYLARKYSIRYSYSMKQLWMHFPEIEYAERFLGIAPEFKGSNRFAELPFSIDELQAGGQLGGKSLLGAQATKRNFLQEAKAYRMVHLSTHASTWNPNFQQASITFTEQDNEREIYLLSSELLPLQISPELLVLSACETGTGDYIQGEGVFSLSRLFTATGTKNVMASLWKVNHVSNSNLLGEFYQELYAKQDGNISQALTASKRNYLNSDGLDELGAHPHYWSGMVLIGNNELDLSSENPYVLWICAGVLPVLVLLFGLWWRKRK